MKKVFEPLTHTSEYDPKLDPSTFVFPGHSGRTSITIEFCDKVGLLKLSRRVLKLKYWPVSLVSTILYYQVPARLDYGRLHRASWTQTELFLTFPPPTIESITLIPLNSDETAGRFRVWLSYGTEPAQLMWDRKVEGGFPELKLLVMPFYSNGIADIDMLSAEATHQRQGAAWQVSGSLGPEGGSVV